MEKVNLKIVEINYFSLFLLVVIVLLLCTHSNYTLEAD